MNESTVSTLLVIAVIGVVGYVIVQKMNEGAPGMPAMTPAPAGPDGTLGGFQAIGRAIKGLFTGDGNVDLGKRSDGSLDVKNVVILPNA